MPGMESMGPKMAIAGAGALGAGAGYVATGRGAGAAIGGVLALGLAWFAVGNYWPRGDGDGDWDGDGVVDDPWPELDPYGSGVHGGGSVGGYSLAEPVGAHQDSLAPSAAAPLGASSGSWAPRSPILAGVQGALKPMVSYLWESPSYGSGGYGSPTAIRSTVRPNGVPTSPRVSKPIAGPSPVPVDRWYVGGTLVGR